MGLIRRPMSLQSTVASSPIRDVFPRERPIRRATGLGRRRGERPPRNYGRPRLNQRRTSASTRRPQPSELISSWALFRSAWRSARAVCDTCPRRSSPMCWATCSRTPRAAWIDVMNSSRPMLVAAMAETSSQRSRARRSPSTISSRRCASLSCSIIPPECGTTSCSGTLRPSRDGSWGVKCTVSAQQPTPVRPLGGASRRCRIASVRATNPATPRTRSSLSLARWQLLDV